MDTSSAPAAVGQPGVPVPIASAVSLAPKCFEATVPPTVDQRSILEANRDACSAAMAYLGAQVASVEYAGSGDSGEGEEVLVYADQDRIRQLPLSALLKAEVGLLRAVRQWEPAPLGRLVVKGVEVERLGFEEALKELCDQMIEHCGHAGFENGDGGRGEMALSVASGLTLEHENYYVESHCHSHRLGGSQDGAPDTDEVQGEVVASAA
jgi:hypothetical protein